MSKRDYYQVLGVGRDASDRDIKQAYRKVALQYHPDRNPGDPSAEERFKEAAQAYDVLSDPEKRAAYDRFGHDGVRSSVHTYASFEDVLASFGSVFEDFFGMGGFRTGSAHRHQPARGADLRHDLAISFHAAARGGERTLEVERSRDCAACGGSGAKAGTRPAVCPMCRGRGQVARTQAFFSIATTCPRCRGQGEVIPELCPECGGDGRVGEVAPIKVKIPAGVSSGTRLRLSGEGEAGHRGGPTGDLYIDLAVEPHERFRREGNDVVLDLPISATQAMLGSKLRVPTLDGETEITVPAGSQPGDTVRIRGKGFPNLRGFGSGAQVVRLEVRIPSNLSRGQREIVRELARALGEDQEHEKR